MGVLVAATAGGVVGYFFLFLITGVDVGVPIVGTLKRNRRAYEAKAEADRYAHMEGWVPGTTVSFKARQYAGEVASNMLGPSIVATSDDPAGGWVTVVNHPAPPLPEFSPAGGDPLAVLRRVDSSEASGHGSGFAGNETAGDVQVLGPGEEGSTGLLVASAERPARFRPPARPRLADGMVEAMVMGPPKLSACIVEPAKRAVTELGCFLALHSSRKMKRTEVTEALWPAEGDTNKGSGYLRNTMLMLRQCWGDELVPNAKGGLYWLPERVTTDWGRFSNLVDDASGDVEIEKLTLALSLVRGMPFEGVADGTYSWATTEMIISDIEYGVLDAAHRLAKLTLTRCDYEHARWAVEKGLIVSPYDRELWRVLLQIAAANGSAELERVYERAKGNLGEDAGDLDEIVVKLRRTR